MTDKERQNGSNLVEMIRHSKNPSAVLEYALEIAFFLLNEQGEQKGAGCCGHPPALEVGGARPPDRQRASPHGA